MINLPETNENEQKLEQKLEVPLVLKPADIFDIFGHEIRIEVIRLLHENIEMTYSSIRDMMKIDPGLLNFHLRKLKGFIKITEKGTYILSDYGKIAYEVLYWTENFCPKVLRDKNIKYPITLNIVSRRVLAFLLDSFVLFLCTGIFLSKDFWFSIYGMFIEIDFSDIITFYTNFFLNYAELFLGAYGYFTVLEAYKGQTLGKYILGIRTIRVDGRKSEILDVAVRNIGKVFFLPFDLLIGLLFYVGHGYLRFFDYYTENTIEKITPVKPAEIAEPVITKAAEANY